MLQIIQKQIRMGTLANPDKQTVGCGLVKNQQKGANGTGYLLWA